MTYAKSLPYLLILCTFLLGCREQTPSHGSYLLPGKAEVALAPPTPQPPPTYPWEDRYTGKYPRITKDFFRCKGNYLNPIATLDREGRESLYFRDCRGSEGHGLPLHEGKEFIYPVLIDVLNAVQEKTGHRVVITTGHRCPMHNAYCDPSPRNYGSRHMLGAEVDFYVEGMEEDPQAVIEVIKSYFDDPFEPFHREGLNVATPPIFNKEIFIKLYLPDEGRDRDNQHPYPYLCLQVRHVDFDGEQTQNYLRY